MPNDPAWINADTGAPEYNARELRRLDATLMFPGSAHRFGARSGVRPGHSPQCVTVSGTTVTVLDICAVVYTGAGGSQTGPYTVALQQEQHELDPADGSNDRIDAIDLQVQDDDEDASTFRRAHSVYVVGTPAASPTAPALSDNAVRLATILVPAGGSPSPSTQEHMDFTVAAGGILPVRDSSGLPTEGRYEGMYVDQRDEDVLLRWNGSVWQTVASAHVPQQVEYFGSSSFDPASFPGARAARVRCQGGGGGGAGAPATSSGQASSGTGGSGGDFAESWFTWAQILAEAGGGTITVTVGSGGSGGTGSGGGTGGTSSFGALVSASGGAGGGVGSASSGWGGGQPPTANGASTGDLVYKGAAAGPSMHNGSEDTAWGTTGGSSHCGGGGRGRRSSTSLAGTDGGVRGGGGGGAANGSSESAQTGGDGGAGFVAIEVY